MWLVPIQSAAIAGRVRGDVSRFSAILLTAVVVVLLMACANVAGLLSQERRGAAATSVCLALGASRGRLVRGLMVECAAIAVLGAAAGLVLGDGF